MTVGNIGITAKLLTAKDKLLLRIAIRREERSERIGQETRSKEACSLNNFKHLAVE